MRIVSAREQSEMLIPWSYRRILIAALSDDEYAAHLAHVESQTQKALEAGMATNVAHAGPVGGYTAQRYAQQQKIIDDIWERNGKHIPRNRQGLMAGGLSGAGKSTVLKQMSIPGVGPVTGNFLTVDPDQMKEALAHAGMTPHVEGLSPLETSGLIHEESSDMAKRLAQRAYAHGTNIVHDGTLANLSGAQKRMAEMHGKGYTTHGVFADIPHTMSMERAASRHRRAHDSFLDGNNPIGGRVVPSAFISAQAPTKPGSTSLNRENFQAMMAQFDHPAHIYDNSGAAPVRIARRVASVRRADVMGDSPQPSSYEEACDLFAQGYMPYEHLLSIVSSMPSPVGSEHSQDWAEIYHRADGPEDPNSSVWFTYLHSAGLIDMDQLLQLIQAAG